MIHYGDITKISGYDVPIVDCIIGGSPCQDLSVAGKRAGLDGERSGLFMEQIRITKEMRARDERSGRTGEFIRPRFLVWENVPGAFSSNKGQDFRIVLEEIAKISDKDAVIPMPPKNKWTTSGAIVGDGWSIAWRILDAQFWGVPQRRRRIALVADFGGGCAQEILFERKSLRRHSEESRTERKGTSEDAQGSIGVHDRDEKAIAYSIENHPADSRVNIDESGKVQTLTSRMGTGGGNVPMVMEAAIGLDAYNQCLTGDKALTLRAARGDNEHLPLVVMDRSDYNQGVNAKYNIGIDENGVAFSCIAKGPGAVCYIDTSHADDVVRTDDVVAPLQARDYKGGKAILCVDQGGGKSGANVTENLCTHGGEPVICLQGNGIDRADTAGCNGKGWNEDTCYTLNTVDRPAVAYPKELKDFIREYNAIVPHQQDQLQTADGASRSLVASTHGAASHHTKTVIYDNVKRSYIVRRLTPLECERLQGFADGWTDIGEYTDSKGKKKKSSDSARYKALGNSIALPPWKWVLKRLCSHYERDATMASLFDGIGGFPCLWEQINGKGTALWASEIEDFPIAVTKKRIE